MPTFNAAFQGFQQLGIAQPCQLVKSGWACRRLWPQSASPVLTLHFSGQVTCERIAALLNGMGVVISKRQVVRLLTAIRSR